MSRRRSTRPKFGEARGWYERDPHTGMGGPKANPTKPDWIGDYVAPVPSYVQASTGRTTPTPAETRRAAAPGSSLTDLASGYLLQTLNDLLTPGPTTREIAEAASRLGVKPISDAIEAVSDTVDEAAQIPRKLARLPKQRVDSFLGRETLGTPTVQQILRAAAQGKAGVNRKGKLTVPATRKAARQLTAAQAAVERSQGGITGLTQPGEAKQFADALAKYTNLDPRFVGAWVQSEGGGFAAGGQAGRNNWLGVGYPGEPTPFGRSDYFSGDADTAAKATADWMRGSIGADMNYRAAEGIQQIIPKAAGKGPQAALRALSESGWGTHIPLVQQNLGSIGVQPPNQKALNRLASAEAQAQKVGIDPEALNGRGQTPGLGDPAPALVSRFKAGMAAANDLEQLSLPYVWGGGHNAGEVQLGSGVDCSGAVSYVLQKMGVDLPGGVVSGEMGNYLEPGPGAVTVYYNPGHTFMKIGNRYFGTSRTNPGGGAGFIEGSGPPDDPTTYSVGHVPGLSEKVALQMGIQPGTAGGSASGITYSADGTTATVTGGGTQEGAGYSNKPITPSFVGGSEVPISELLQTLALEPQLGGGEEDDELGLIDRILAGGRV